MVSIGVPRTPKVDWYARFEVDGKPVTKKREHYPDKREKAFGKCVAWAYKISRIPLPPMMPGDLAMHIEWYRGRNKDGSLPKSKMDGDNILKSVKDALSGIAYDDDKQIKYESCYQIPTDYKADRIMVWLGVLA